MGPAGGGEVQSGELGENHDSARRRVDQDGAVAGPSRAELGENAELPSQGVANDEGLVGGRKRRVV